MVQLDHLGRALATLWEKRGKTQEEVARSSGITASMISNYERSRERPRVESLWKILQGLDCTLMDLEAALRFVAGEPFPVESKTFRIAILPRGSSPVDGALGADLNLGELSAQGRHCLEQTTRALHGWLKLVEAEAASPLRSPR